LPTGGRNQSLFLPAGAPGLLFGCVMDGGSLAGNESSKASLKSSDCSEVVFVDFGRRAPTFVVRLVVVTVFFITPQSFA
jgi:hypothetical protein